MKKSTLTAERLRELLHYDSETGVFKRKISTSNYVRVGDIAGSYVQGYREIRIDGSRYRSHRLVWLYVHGKWPKNEIDHINGVRDDNRLINLREATHTENSYNKGAAKNSTSGVKGVSWDLRKKKWRAQCTVNGKQYHQGYFVNIADAECAANKFREQHHGHFAQTCSGNQKRPLLR